MIDEPVGVIPYDERWADLAAREMERLRSALPGVRLEHIGATAVPGMED